MYCKHIVTIQSIQPINKIFLGHYETITWRNKVDFPYWQRISYIFPTCKCNLRQLVLYFFSIEVSSPPSMIFSNLSPVTFQRLVKGHSLSHCDGVALTLIRTGWVPPTQNGTTRHGHLAVEQLDVTI